MNFCEEKDDQSAEEHLEIPNGSDSENGFVLFKGQLSFPSRSRNKVKGLLEDKTNENQ